MTDKTMLQIIQRTREYLDDVEKLIKQSDSTGNKSKKEKYPTAKTNTDDEEYFNTINDAARFCLNECLKSYKLDPIDINDCHDRYPSYYLGLFSMIYTMMKFRGFKYPLRETKKLVKQAMAVVMAGSNSKNYTSVDVFRRTADKLADVRYDIMEKYKLHT